MACGWFRGRWLWVHGIFYSMSEHFKRQIKQDKKHIPWCLLPVLLTSLLPPPCFGRSVSSSISLQCVGQCQAMTRSNDRTSVLDVLSWPDGLFVSCQFNCSFREKMILVDSPW
jgi:hypothetical protein